MTTRKACTATTTTTMPAAQQKCKSTTSPRRKVKKVSAVVHFEQMHRNLHSSGNKCVLPVWNFMWNRHKHVWSNIYDKIGIFWENLHRFLLEIRCSLFFQIYTKKHLNITREQRRRNSTLNLDPCSTIYTSLWSSQFWVEGLAMEVLHVRGPPLICIFLSCQDLRLQ